MFRDSLDDKQGFARHWSAYRWATTERANALAFRRNSYVKGYSELWLRGEPTVQVMHARRSVYEMATDIGSAHSAQRQPSDALLTLAQYLEVSLDAGTCVVMLRQSTDVCAVYVGDPAGTQDGLTRHGTISAALADEILEVTHAGANRISVGEQTYRFVRSFTHIRGSGAVVFAPHWS